MNRKYWVYALPALLLLILVLVFFPRQKTVTITINGESQIYQSKKTKVGDFLNDVNILIYPDDRVEPELEERIKDGESIEIEQAVTYLITADEESKRLVTTPDSPKNIFENLGIDNGSEDLVLVNGFEHPYESVITRKPFSTLELRRSIELRIQIADEVQIIQTTAQTIGKALWDTKILINHNEALSLPSNTPLTQNTSLIISPTQEIEIIIGNKNIKLHSSEKTVGEVLAQTGISLQNLDYSIPPENQPNPEEGIIEVVRVQEAILGEQELIPFYTLYQPMPNVEIDSLVTVEPGEYGLKAQRIRVRYENGVEIYRSVEDEWVVREPVQKIEGYGTQITLKTLDTPDGPIEYYRTVKFHVTSYYPGDLNAPPWYGRVYCGGRVFEAGFVAVDLNLIPCGTQLYIPGYGFGVAMDTGYFTGAWLDVGYVNEEYIPWLKDMDVYFLSPVPPLGDISYIIPPGELY